MQSGVDRSLRHIRQARARTGRAAELERLRDTLIVEAADLRRLPVSTVAGALELVPGMVVLHSDALGDARLVTHLARATVQAYCGAPVVDGRGTCVGTLCHFDVRPRLVPETEIPVMERIGKLLAAACLGARPEPRSERVDA